MQGHAGGITRDVRTFIRIIKKKNGGGEKSASISPAVKRTSISLDVFSDESVLKSIDVRQRRLRLFEVRMDFLFSSTVSVLRFSIRHHSPPPTPPCQWQDAHIDIQYIWAPCGALAVLKGATNAGTVIKWPATCFVNFLACIFSQEWDL